MIPPVCGFVFAWKAQMEALRGCGNVILVLGTCPRCYTPDLVNPTCRTEKIVAALRMLGYKV